MHYKFSRLILVEKKNEAYFTNGLVLFVFFIVASQQISAIFTSPFTVAMVAANNNKVQCVTDTVKIILFELRKVEKAR